MAARQSIQIVRLCADWTLSHHRRNLHRRDDERRPDGRQSMSLRQGVGQADLVLRQEPRRLDQFNRLHYLLRVADSSSGEGYRECISVRVV